MFGIMVVTYLFGSVLVAEILYRRVANADIFRAGSGNPGFMNSLKLMGWPCALVVLLFDIGKGVFPMYISFTHHYGLGSAVGLSMFALAGHCASIFYCFRGGKGISTSVGILFGSMLYLGFGGPAIALLTGVGVFATYYLIGRGRFDSYQEVSMTLMVAATFLVIFFSAVEPVVKQSAFIMAATVVAMTWVRANRVQSDPDDAASWSAR